MKRLRKIATFLYQAEIFIDVVGLGAIGLFFVNYLPREILNVLPATGGDTGSHFWPLYTLKNFGLPHWQVKTWNPGNLAGEPHLLYYFPFPFLLMALASYFIPIGMAFNIGTILPVFLFPFGVYVCVRGLGYRFPAPLLSASTSLLFLYNESSTMWGGNSLSTLAGQFAHQYAITLLFCLVGTIAYELRERKIPWLSPALFFFLAISHSYVLMVVPFFFISFFLFFNYQNRLVRFKHLLFIGGFGCLLSAWFLIPLIGQAKWTTAFKLVWRFKGAWKEIVPPILHPAVVIFTIGAFSLIYFLRWSLFPRLFLGRVLFWLVPIFGSVALFFIYPKVGLVDVRAIPQAQACFTILAVLLVFPFFKKVGRVPTWIVTLPILLVTLFWVQRHISNFGPWMKWNYSGWQSKELYPPLLELSDKLRGDFSLPRVIYEQSDVNKSAGTERVFEMLPYFAKRATLESVYMQSTIVAPMAFFMQSKISLTPSCPIPGYLCPHYNLMDSEKKLQLMGVGNLILTSRELLTQAKSSSYLKPDGVYGPWNLFNLSQPPTLAEIIVKEPQVIAPAEWKKKFFEWFTAYDGSQSLIYLDDGHSAERLKNAFRKNDVGEKPCEVKLEVEISKLKLLTTCPGRPHLIKFSYHPAWRTDTGDPIILISPGFMALVPTKGEINFYFVRDFLSIFSEYLSWIGLLFFFLTLVFLNRRSASHTKMT